MFWANVNGVRIYSHWILIQIFKNNFYYAHALLVFTPEPAWTPLTRHIVKTNTSHCEEGDLWLLSELCWREGPSREGHTDPEQPHLSPHLCPWATEHKVLQQFHDPLSVKGSNVSSTGYWNRCLGVDHLLTHDWVVHCACCLWGLQNTLSDPQVAW